MRIVQGLSFVLALLLMPYAVYNGYTGLNFAYMRAFHELPRWVSDGWTAPFAQITTGMQISYLVLWALPVIFGVVASVGAILTFSQIARGHVFATGIPKAVRWLGVGIFGTAFTQTLAGSVTPKLMSWNNPAGAEPLRFFYNSETFGLMFCGIAFWIIGHIMLQVVTVQQGRNTFG